MDSTNPASVALYWDFENLHAALCEARQEGSYGKQDNRFRVQEPLVNVHAVVALAASLGPITINRAYCNWQYFGRYRDALLHNAMELIQCSPLVEPPRTEPTFGFAWMRWRMWRNMTI